MGNPFYDLWDDSYNKGGEVWGFRSRFVSWRDRPDQTERPKGSPAVIAQEHPETAEEAFVASSANLFRLEDDQTLAPFFVPKKWPVMAVHDPGIDTGAWLWLARVCGDTHKPMLDGDIYVAEEWDPAGKSVTEQVREAERRATYLRVVQSIIDPTAHTRTHGGDRYIRLADLYSERGLHFGDGSNDVGAAAAAIGDALMGRRLWLSNRCSQTIADVRRMTLDNLKDCHFGACLRYGMLAGPERMSGLSEPKVYPQTHAEMRAEELARQIDKMQRGDEDYDYE